jgi:hypothetical protein
VMEVVVPSSVRRSSSSKPVSAGRKVSGTSSASLLSVEKRDSAVFRPSLAKLASGKQTAEMGGGALSPEIPVLQPETLSASRGDGHSGHSTFTVTSGSTPAVGEEEPRSKVARLSTDVLRGNPSLRGR